MNDYNNLCNACQCLQCTRFRIEKNRKRPSLICGFCLKSVISEYATPFFKIFLYHRRYQFTARSVCSGSTAYSTIIGITIATTHILSFLLASHYNVPIPVSEVNEERCLLINILSSALNPHTVWCLFGWLNNKEVMLKLPILFYIYCSWLLAQFCL